MSRFDLQAQFFFDLDLDPEPLAVEAVLIALLVPGHGEVALIGVLVGPAPGVVDAHRVVGRDRAVEERPARLAAVLGPELFEDLALVPELQDGPLPGREIDLRFDFFERHRNVAFALSSSNSRKPDHGQQAFTEAGTCRRQSIRAVGRPGRAD